MVRGLPFDNTKRPADHQSLKPAAWSKHPAVNMWMGYADALALYLLMNIELWAQRCSPTTGLPYNNGLMLENIQKWRIRYKADQPDTLVAYHNTAFPPWWGDARVHDSDKGILYRKDHTAYAHFKRYALQYEQYVWPYQIEEEARRRQRQAAGVEAEGRESEGDEEPDSFVPDELKDEKDSEEAKTKKGKRAKKTKAAKGAKKPSRKRRLEMESEVVELDEDDEQVDAAVVAAMQKEHEVNGHGKAAVKKGRPQKGKRQKRHARHSVAEESKAAIETTEEEAEEEAVTMGDEDNVVHSEPRARGRGRKAAVKREALADDTNGANEVSARSEPQQQQQDKPKKRQKHKKEAAMGGVEVVERRRSGRRSSLAASST